MIPSTSNSQNLKVVLAIVVLFLGWLIASMIPRSEAPWDKTSTSFLVRRPVAGAEGELAGESADYRRLWSKDKENWDPENKNVTIDYDSQFFGSSESSDSSADSQETETSAEKTVPEAEQQWNDEITVDSGTVPGVQVDQPPQWDDDFITETPVGNAEELAPPNPLDADWDADPTTDSETAKETDEPLPSSSSPSAEASPEEEAVAAGPSEIGPAAGLSEGEPDGNGDSHDEDDSALIAQAELPDSDSISAGSDQLPSDIQSSGQELSPAANESQPALISEAETEPEAEAETEVSSSAGDSAPNAGAGDLYAFPNKRPLEQSADPTSLIPSGTPVSESSSSSGKPSPASLPFKTLVPSNAAQTVVKGENPPAADEGLISQVSAALPESQPRQSTSAYYEQPSPTAVSSPMSIAVYTAGPGENWDGIAAKFGLSADEAARYYEVNSFRINDDRTVSEGMKLMLPKR